MTRRSTLAAIVFARPPALRRSNVSVRGSIRSTMAWPSSRRRTKTTSPGTGMKRSPVMRRSCAVRTPLSPSTEIRAEFFPVDTTSARCVDATRKIARFRRLTMKRTWFISLLSSRESWSPRGARPSTKSLRARAGPRFGGQSQRPDARMRCSSFPTNATARRSSTLRALRYTMERSLLWQFPLRSPKPCRTYATRSAVPDGPRASLAAGETATPQCRMGSRGYRPLRRTRTDRRGAAAIRVWPHRTSYSRRFRLRSRRSLRRADCELPQIEPGAYSGTEDAGA